MRVPHLCLTLIALVPLSVGCKMAESYLAYEADKLGRQHSTDPDAQYAWDRYARYDSDQFEPSPAARH